MNPPEYTVVIPTLGRPEMLRQTLASLKSQTWKPTLLVVVDASKDRLTEEICSQFKGSVDICYKRAMDRSAAMQRNEGARMAETPLVAFSDDDMEFAPQTMEQVCSVWLRDDAAKIGGVAARIIGLEHKQPRGLLWWYYRIQAGYNHPHYGGHLFGPALNCLPAYTLETGELIPAMWLNSGCVVYSREKFMVEQFPSFEGYSFMEDVHLSARIAKTSQLYFHRAALVKHLDGGSSVGTSVENARMRVRNQRRVATDVMKLSSPAMFWKFLLHRFFLTVCLLRRPNREAFNCIRGIWSS